MAKRLEREFARYDVDALDSDEYLGMPRGVRNDAYLYLLVLTGRSRKRRSDGTLSRTMADDLAHRMGCSPVRLLTALRDVGMVVFDEVSVTVTKYAKWQQTRAEIDLVRAERSEAGRAGGLASGEARRNQNSSKPEAKREQIGSKNKPEESKRREERELDIPPPPLEPAPEALELEVGLSDLIGQVQPKGKDVLVANSMWMDFHDRFAGVTEMVAVVQADQQRRRTENREPIHSIEGCRLPLRWEYDKRADRQQLRARPDGSSHTSALPSRIDLTPTLDVLAKRTLRVVEEPAT